MRTFASLLCLALLLGGARRAAHAEEDAPPLRMTLHVASPATVSYGATIRVAVVVENTSRSARDFYWDHRSDGVLQIQLEDEDGLVWVPAPRPPLLVGTPGLTVDYKPVWLGAQPGFPVPTTIRAGGRQQLRFAFDTFLLQGGAPGRPAGRWHRALPPGRYTVRARYEKTDALVPAGPPRWNPRLIQLRPTQAVRAWPKLWTGRMEADVGVEVTAPRQDDVDALRKRVEILTTRNRALRKQLDAIREVLKGG